MVTRDGRWRADLDLGDKKVQTLSYKINKYTGNVMNNMMTIANTAV